MAMRCVRDGNPLSMKNYILYGAWADPKGLSKNVVVSGEPTFRTNMAVCAWCDVWKKHHLIEYGKLYCTWVDENLLFGFNPELRLEMSKVMSHGDDLCEFNWLDGCFNSQAQLDEMNAQRAELIPLVTRDFLYHCGHILSTFRRALYLELGLVRGRAILEDALAEYAEMFGRDKENALHEESRLDFLSVE